MNDLDQNNTRPTSPLEHLVRRYTPGPWYESNDDGVIEVRARTGDSATYYSIAERIGGSRDRVAANARLIKRAPELLELLQECAEDLRCEIEARAPGELPRRIKRDLQIVERAEALIVEILTEPKSAIDRIVAYADRLPL